MKMPKPDDSGTYRFDDGSTVERARASWAAGKWCGWPADGLDPLPGPDASYFHTPEDAARALGHTID
jgi:hypothetical protein